MQKIYYYILFQLGSFLLSQNSKVENTKNLGFKNTITLQAYFTAVETFGVSDYGGKSEASCFHGYKGG